MLGWYGGTFQSSRCTGDGVWGGPDDLFTRPKMSNLDIYFFFIFLRNVLATKSPLLPPRMVIALNFHILFVAFDSLIMGNS